MLQRKDTPSNDNRLTVSPKCFETEKLSKSRSQRNQTQKSKRKPLGKKNFFNEALNKKLVIFLLKSELKNTIIEMKNTLE